VVSRKSDREKGLPAWRSTRNVIPQGKKMMKLHASTCLKGPVSQARRCWKKGLAKGKESNRHARRPAREGRAGDGIRHDLVARVRKEIAAGTYDTPEKWQAALDRLLEDCLPG
jgi:hypothetical protein